MNIKPLKIGNLIAKLPLIQGGMGVGVSLSKLAGAVAKEGGIGIISTAQIGYDQPDFEKQPIETNLRAIETHIKKAKEIAGITSDGEKRTGIGMVGVNIMVATKRYEDYVKAAAQAGADIIISGAGLPISLPEYVKGYETKIAPIVSSKKAAEVILKLWDRKYNRTADCVVIEGAHAGGHLGFSKEELDSIGSPDYDSEYDKEIQAIIAVANTYAEKYNTHIPVIVAGGIMNEEKTAHIMELGAEGVQIATPFVTTEECDASTEFKMAYVNAKAEDIKIIISPVGMPARAIANPFLDRVYNSVREKVGRCHQCLEKCNPASTPYCITKALVNAVKGDIDNGLIFCGDNVQYLNKITTVKDVIATIFGKKQLV